MLRSRSRCPVLMRNATTAPTTRIASNPSRRMMRNDCQNASHPLPAGRVSATTSGSPASIASRRRSAARTSLAAHRALEVGEDALHRRDEPGILRARRRLDRLERHVGVGRACRRVAGSAALRRAQRLLEQRHDRRATRPARCTLSDARAPVAVAHRQRAQVRRPRSAPAPARARAARRHRRAGDARPHDLGELRRRCAPPATPRCRSRAAAASATRASTPSPAPVTPWQDAQRCANSPSPFHLLRVRRAQRVRRTPRRSSAARASASRRSRPSASRRCPPTPRGTSAPG